jgi:hypothetical protein
VNGRFHLLDDASQHQIEQVSEAWHSFQTKVDNGRWHHLNRVGHGEGCFPEDIVHLERLANNVCQRRSLPLMGIQSHVGKAEDPITKMSGGNDTDFHILSGRSIGPFVESYYATRLLDKTARQSRALVIDTSGGQVNHRLAGMRRVGKFSELHRFYKCEGEIFLEK